MLEIKIGGIYEISVLRQAGYASVERSKLRYQGIKEDITVEAVRYKKGSENLLLTKEPSGLLRLFARYDKNSGKPAEIFREKKK